MSADTERLAALLDAWLAGAEAAPKSAEEAELLSVAAQLRDLEAVAPAPGNLRRGRAAFIAAGVGQAEARRQGRRWPRFGWGWGGSRRGLAPLALALCLLLTVGAATTAQAQTSLPGDTLYPVKRLTETVKVSMTHPEERESLRAELQARRRAEALALLARRRAEAVQFEGRVATVIDGRLVVDGVEVVVDLDSLASVAAGALVRVLGLTGADGVLRAQRIEVLMPAPGAPEAPEQVAEATPVTRLLAGGERPEITPTRSATERSPAPAPTRWPSPTPVAALVPTLTAVPTLPATPPPDGPRLRDRQVVEWTGFLEQVSGDWWVVAGQAFHRPGGRVQGDARVGALVFVRAERRDGKYYLVELRVLNPAPRPEVVEWRGLIEAIEGEIWTVGGLAVTVGAATEIIGTPEVGRLALIKAELYPDGRRLALRVVVEGPRVVEFSGVLEAFEDEMWWVSGRALRLVPGLTEVRGQPWVGARVDVRARSLEGDLLEALLLVVVDAPPETPTADPTATAGVMPGPPATATPAATGPALP